MILLLLYMPKMAAMWMLKSRLPELPDSKDEKEFRGIPKGEDGRYQKGTTGKKNTEHERY